MPNVQQESVTFEMQEFWVCDDCNQVLVNDEWSWLDALPGTKQEANELQIRIKRNIGNVYYDYRTKAAQLSYSRSEEGRREDFSTCPFCELHNQGCPHLHIMLVTHILPQHLTKNDLWRLQWYWRVDVEREREQLHSTIINWVRFIQEVSPDMGLGGWRTALCNSWSSGNYCGFNNWLKDKDLDEGEHLLQRLRNNAGSRWVHSTMQKPLTLSVALDLRFKVLKEVDQELALLELIKEDLKMYQPRTSNEYLKILEAGLGHVE